MLYKDPPFYSSPLLPPPVTSLSTCSPASVTGDAPTPEDDVLIYKFFSEGRFSHGLLQMKRFAVKPRCKLGDNLLVSQYYEHYKKTNLKAFASNVIARITTGDTLCTAMSAHVIIMVHVEPAMLLMVAQSHCE